MTTLDYLAAIQFSGADAGNFLHNQLSADILALAEGESVFACYCEPKGRVLALMLVCRVGEGYYVIMSSDLATPVMSRLKMYVMRSAVSIEALEGSSVFALPEAGIQPDNGEPAVMIPIPGDDKALAVRKHSPGSDSNASGRDAWKAVELERGICWLDPETSAQFLPQMLGFDELGAVNFRKGCYPGQEIVARTRYLGKVKRHPRVLQATLDSCPAPLEKVQINSDGEEYDAVVVDCATAGDGRSVLFVVTRMDPDLLAEQVGSQGQVFPLA